MSKTDAANKLGPIELEVIYGTIRSTESEIEAAVERTSRSPMIRDQHDYRVALFDAKGRKLTGRSYSALVEPVFEYFDEGDIHPGDVFFWNDPYNSCGGIGHVPDLCTTVPIFYDDTLVGFSQVFGHHDDVGGMVPGSLPVGATDMWAEGLVVPPIKLYDKGVLNEAAYKIIFRNSRLSEHLRGDVDADSRGHRPVGEKNRPVQLPGNVRGELELEVFEVTVDEQRIPHRRRHREEDRRGRNRDGAHRNVVEAEQSVHAGLHLLRRTVVDEQALRRYHSPRP